MTTRLQSGQEQRQNLAARHVCATALAYLHHGLSVDTIWVDGDGGGETTGGFRVINSLDAGRIGIVGQAVKPSSRQAVKPSSRQAVELEWIAERKGQSEAIREILNSWQETVEYSIQEEDNTGDEAVLSGGSLMVSAPWAIAIVAVNRDLINELAELLLASDGHLESAAFLPIVDGRITDVSVEDNLAAFRLLEPHQEQLREITDLVSDWRQLDQI